MKKVIFTIGINLLLFFCSSAQNGDDYIDVDSKEFKKSSNTTNFSTKEFFCCSPYYNLPYHPEIVVNPATPTQGQSITLSTPTIPGVTYKWIVNFNPSGPSITNMNPSFSISGTITNEKTAMYIYLEVSCGEKKVRTKKSIKFLPKKTCDFIVNGDFELSANTNTGSDQFEGVKGWQILFNTPAGKGDWYEGTNAFPATVVTSATNNYAGFWIAGHSGIPFREGIQTNLQNTVTTNSGAYKITFDAGSALNGMSAVGPVECRKVAVYGIKEGTVQQTFVGTTSIANLYGGNITLLGEVQLSNPNITNTVNFTPYSISFDSGSLPYNIKGLIFTRSQGCNALGLYAFIDNVLMCSGK